jgi:hypothetical protein
MASMWYMCAAWTLMAIVFLSLAFRPSGSQPIHELRVWVDSHGAGRHL